MLNPGDYELSITKLEDALLLVKAGKDALSDENRTALVENINFSLKAFVGHKSGENFADEEGLWIDLFEQIAENQIAPVLADEIDTQLFYDFGEMLSGQQISHDSRLDKLIHAWLDLFRQSAFLQNIIDVKSWEVLIARLIRHSNFTFFQLFEQRVKDYRQKTLFRVLHATAETRYSWHHIDEMVKSHTRGLAQLALEGREEPAKIAFLMENSIEMVVLDLACLTGGITNIMIAANSVPQQIEFILNQTKAEVVLAMNDKQLAKIKSIKNELPHLRKVVLVQGSSIEDWVISLEEMIVSGYSFPQEAIAQLQRSIKTDSLASVMYTSGTTGDPKGIMFTHMNIVYKRFCRAMALPKISDDSRYLAYLPLFHTFGRWLEMTGAIFWGAEYAFMENPALSTMLDNMKRVKPTIFISIPKKWIQLYDYISSKVNVEFAEDDEIQLMVNSATGGALQFGLSAAGYLEPDIFKFFQRYKVELMSGFGMTEATGGITMTYPGEYRENSLGKPLPGIDVKLGDDGEMLIKGSYVMKSYYGLSNPQDAFMDGWFPTGDIMKQDSRGFYEIIDRKKEIYKNIKGETIAPQKIENLFRDFEFVNQVFLIGDHKQFNTVLIYPDKEAGNGKIDQMTREDKHIYFSSVVVTVNKFLAPFERIIDFRLIERPFSAEKGELTPKGTYKRRIIEKNFESVYDEMYTKNYISLFWDELELRIPNWFLREKGCLIGDIKTTQQGLVISKYNKTLTLSRHKSYEYVFRIGDYYYENNQDYLDFQLILANPFYWLGNQDLIDFAGETIFQWYRLDEPVKKIQFHSIVAPKIVKHDISQKLSNILAGNEKSLFGLNYAVIHLQSPIADEGRLGTQYIDMVLEEETLPIYKLAISIISMPHFSSLTEIRREMFKLGLKVLKELSFEAYLGLFISVEYGLLNEEITDLIAKTGQSETILSGIQSVIKTNIAAYNNKLEIEKTAIPSLLNLLAVYGMYHPTKYKRVRQLIVRYQLRQDIDQLQKYSRMAREKLLNGFRNWLGENQQIAVDVETGKEYQWRDVVIFEENIRQEDKEALLKSITNTAVLREAIFLFTPGTMIRLYDIPLGGVWVSLISEAKDKSVFRVSIQSRFQGSYDIIYNLNRIPFSETVRSEINWLIHAGAPAKGISLTEDFGGYWQEDNLWTEEFVSGDTALKVLSKAARRNNEETFSRMYHLWPFFVWSATAAHVSFWRRSNYKVELDDKSTSNIIVATHDYQTRMRLVSIAKRNQSKGILYLVADLYKKFIAETFVAFPFVKRDEICNFIFCGIIDSEGEERGLEQLDTLLADAESKPDIVCYADFYEDLKKFIINVRKSGFIQKQVFFAAKRFHRWFRLNAKASFSAQARTLNELFVTYQLHEVEKKAPEARTRFYYETVFKNSSSEVRQAISSFMMEQHAHHFSHEKILRLISNIDKEFDLNEKEKFFLSRLSYPHLKPTDSAVLVTTLSEGDSLADVVVHLEDSDGFPYLVRKPITPKEISRLHKLFLDADLPVSFLPEHRFIVAVSEREHIIGGLFYSYTDHKTVYMEKIVVSSNYRRKGISEGLMNEFFNRLQDEHISFVTTGFFRPEYFYRFGFKIERKYAGLVKNLVEHNIKDPEKVIG